MSYKEERRALEQAGISVARLRSPEQRGWEVVVLLRCRIFDPRRCTIMMRTDIPLIPCEPRMGLSGITGEKDVSRYGNIRLYRSILSELCLCESLEINGVRGRQEMSSPENRRWWIAIAAVIMQLCLGTVYAWSIFKNPMMTSHGWSETVTQGAFMIYAVMFAISVAAGGALVDRKGPRFVGLIGAVLFGSGLILAGYANAVQSIPLLYVAYGFVAGLGGGFGYVTPITTLIHWFPDKRGLVTGLAVMGYGLGSFVMGNVGPALILSLGVARVFFLWGGVSLLLVSGAVVFLQNPPSGWTPAGTGPDLPSDAPLAPSFTFSQAVRTGRFWLLWGMLFIIAGAGLGLISQLSPMAQDVMLSGISGEATPLRMNAVVIASGGIVAVAALFNGAGRLLWAWLSDALGRWKVFAILFSTQAAGYLLLAQSTHIAVFSAAAFYLMACYGGGLACMPAFTADEFGHAHIGKIYGVIFSACALGGIAGPFTLAFIKETTGSFATALQIEAAFLAAAFFLALSFRGRRHEETLPMGVDAR